MQLLINVIALGSIYDFYFIKNGIHWIGFAYSLLKWNAEAYEWILNKD